MKMRRMGGTMVGGDFEFGWNDVFPEDAPPPKLSEDDGTSNDGSVAFDIGTMSRNPPLAA